MATNAKKKGRPAPDDKPSAPSFPLRCASVDVGSNAMRFLAAEFSSPGHFTVLEEMRSAVRLGHGVFLTGKLSKKEMDEALAVFRTHRQRMDALGITLYRAAATSAVRDSENGEEFLRRVRAEAGLDLATINGSEEARLVHRAVTSRLDLSEGTWMLVDLGGGSVEVSLADASGILWSESHTMGAVRLLEELTGSAEDPGRFLALLTEYAGTLRVPSSLERDRPAGYVATGGNIETLAQLAMAPRGLDGVSRLPVRDLSTLIQKLAGLSYRERVVKLSLREDRADVILPAAIVYERLARLAGVQEVLVPGVGVKEGLLLDMVDVLFAGAGAGDRGEGQVEKAALALGRRYRFDESHALNVARHALTLFDQLQEVHGLGAADRKVLHAAAMLHDIGSYVSYKGHHKHTFYLVSNSSMPGFSARETLAVANVARYHRRSPPRVQHEGFSALDTADRRRVIRLASLLRLADALDREHRQTVEGVRARAGRGRLTLGLRGRGDLLLEGWALKRKADLFEKTFGLKVVVLTQDKGDA